MECVLVWLAVMAATFHMAQAMCTQEGRVRVIGIKTEDVAAGRVEICEGQAWRRVCDEGWNQQAAMLVCQQLFQGSNCTVEFCGNSCLGEKSGKGLTGYNCTGSEDTLFNCGAPTRPNQCPDHAGILCCRDRTSCPLSLMAEDSTLPTVESSLTPNATSTTPVATTDCQCKAGADTDATATDSKPNNVDRRRADLQGGSGPCSSLTTLGGGLGALTAILAILLVGVVIGWVWSCSRKSGTHGIQERSLISPHPTFPNPSYTVTSPTTTHAPSVQYSSLGPRGTPLNHSPSAAQPKNPAIYDVINEKPPFSGGEEGIYHVLEGPLEAMGEGGEGVYHVLEGPQEESGDTEELDGDYHLLGEAGGGEGLVYEVPISPAPSQPAAAQPGGEPMDTEYSKLQHQ